MAGASDKARFYLEQSVPELKEYERKKIFSTEEIASIARKRSVFEHKLSSRDSQATDYVRYAEFEINVESLRRKRVKRLRIRASTHTGQRKIFFILERATRKFPGDVGLWMQQIEYARRQRAYKKLSQILTKAVRLHPNMPDLWIYAAQFMMEEHADMTEARSYMQRGLRFCKSSKSLWREYMKLELSYIAKLDMRRQILGINEEPRLQKPTGPVDNEDAGTIALSQGIQPNLGPAGEVEDSALQKLNKAPALTGAIPIAIFDAAMAQFDNDDELALDLFDTVEAVGSTPCLCKILTHIADHMTRSGTDSWRALVCNVKVSCVGIPVTSPEFPKAFKNALHHLQGASPEVRSCMDLVATIQAWLDVFLSDDTLDAALRQVMASTGAYLQAGADSGKSISTAF